MPQRYRGSGTGLGDVKMLVEGTDTSVIGTNGNDRHGKFLCVVGLEIGVRSRGGCCVEPGGFD